MNATPESLPQTTDVKDRLDLNEEGKRAMADMKWINRQHHLGTFAEYAGEWIGVFKQEVVGHDPSLIQLRIKVEQDRGITRDQLATTFVPDSKGTGVGRVWLA